ncbi:MAG: ATP-binding protein [Betaproteobacteria bacterium]|nr:ATP-binding protein [Betaproteobacteria bacterium]
MTRPAPELERLLARAESVLARLEALLPPTPAEPDWESAIAFRWRRRQGQGALAPVRATHRIRLDQLLDIDEQKRRIDDNTRQFVAGRSANNVLLTGARGTGKSSLIKALLNEYSADGLRLIEVDKNDLMDLPDIVELLAPRAERFVLFCDDLSFEEAEPGYKALKSVLDGSVAALPDNVLIYATSNRRHLMPEFFSENLEARHVGGEVHPGDATEQKVSLSERFGLWLSFYPFDQDAYLDIVARWLEEFGAGAEDIACARQPALQWALMRGSRNGRVAWQFARDRAGRLPR